MTSEERDLITGLFNRLRGADSTSKDQEAEHLISQLTGSQPGAPYRLVQTVLVQEHALSNATVRIQQLERQVAEARAATKASEQQTQGGGSFLSGLFGHHAAPASPQPPLIPPQQLPQPSQGYPQNAPQYPATANMAPSAGGGFLRGALQTAAGVAGGALIAQSIGNLLGHHSGPFGGGYGGGGGFFGGGGDYGGRGDVIENTEIVNNNYIDERGNGDGESRFLGEGNFDPGHHGLQREGNEQDIERGAGSGGGSVFDDTGFDTRNPFDTPADGLGGMAVDNTFDSENTDAGNSDFGGDGGGDYAGDSGSGGDDGSLV